MKKLLLMLLLSILVFSCEKDEGVLVPTDEQNVEIRAKKNKVQICHKLGNGQFNLIEVNGNAEQAHINHGDGYPGECYNEEGIIAGQEFMSGECILIPVSDVVDGCDGLDNNCNGVIDEGVPEECENGVDDDCDGQIDEDCITCIEEYADCELCIYMQPEENIENTCGYYLAISFGATIVYNDGTQISIGSFYDDVEDVVIYNYGISFPDGSSIGILEENPNEYNTCWDVIAPLVDFKGFDACQCEIGGNCSYTVCLDNDGDGYGNPNHCMGYHSDIPPPGYARGHGDCDDEDPTIQTNCL